MKKQLMMGMILAISLVGQQSFAAPIRTAEALRTKMTEEVKKSGAKDAIDLLRGLAEIAQKGKLTEVLSAILQGKDAINLSDAMKRTIKAEGQVAGVKQEVTVVVAEIAKSIAMADQILNGPNKIIRGDLDAAGQAHFDVMKDLVVSSTNFLKLADRTSDMRNDLTAVQKQEAAAFAQQLSLIPELFKMETADAQAHMEIMNKAVAARKAGMNGDQALASVLKEGKTDDAYRAKLEEILGCIR